MLLTKLIPPRSQPIKDAVACFNRFLEEPHAKTDDKLELVICGGRGCGKTTIASGMVIKAMHECGCDAAVLRRRMDSFRTDTRGCLHYAARFSDSTQYIVDDEMYPQSGLWKFWTQGKESKMFFFDGEGAFARTRNLERERIGVDEFRPKVIWVECADEFEGQEQVEKTLGEVVFADNPIWIYTFNPPMHRSHWACRFAGLDGSPLPPYRKVFQPCFLDMEESMVGKTFFKNADLMRRMNLRQYQNQYAGIPQED